MLDIHLTTTPAFKVAVDGDEFRYQEINEACLHISGVRLEEQIGRRPQDCFAPPFAETLLAHYRRCVALNETVVYETETVLPGGYTCWRTTLMPLTSPGSHAVVVLLGFCFDATAERMAERASSALHEKLSSAIGAIDGGFWVYEIATGAFETSRPLAELIAGPGHATLCLADYAGHIHAEDLGVTEIMAAEDRSEADYRIIAYDGRTRWLRGRRRVIRDAAGNPMKVVGLVLDVTEQKEAMRTLEGEATTDALTRLKNRRAFDRIAAQHFGDSPASGPVGIVLIDLDGFKPINDRHGHRAGDEILRKVAKRIAACVRPADTLARIGGDEFAVLTPDGARTEGVAMRIHRAFAKPFQLAEEAVFVGASIGTAIQDAADLSPAALFERADRVLYARKQERSRLTA